MSSARLPRPRVAGAAACAAALALGCADGPSAGGPAAPTCGEPRLLVATSTFDASLVGAVTGRGVATLRAGLDLGGDPVLSTSRGRSFFVARDTDLVFELDACGVPVARTAVRAPEERRSVNPQGVAVAPDGALVVPLFDVPRLRALRDGAIAWEIDLAPYDDDGNPQASGVVTHEVEGAAKAFVTLERLDDLGGLASTRDSALLRVDLARRAVDATLPLLARNPFGQPVLVGDRLFLASAGNFDRGDEDRAGVEVVDLVASTSRLLVPERALRGASAVQVAVAGRCGALLVAGPERDVNPTALWLFDAETGALLGDAPLYGPTPSFQLFGLAFRDDGARLFVGDRRPDAGGAFPVHAFRRTGGCAYTLEADAGFAVPQPPVALL